MEARHLKLLSRISMAFLGPGTLDARMDAVLALIGEHIAVSRAYVFLDSEDRSHASRETVQNRIVLT